MCFDLGLLPSFGWFGEAFRKLPFDLQVLPLSKSPAMEQAISLDRRELVKDPNTIETDSARLVDPLVERALADLDIPSAGQVTFRLDERPGVAFKAFRLHGGVALLTEDVSRIDERRQALRSRQEVLRERNTLLAHDKEVRLDLLRLQRERDLFEEVDETLSSSMEEINDVMDSLPAVDSPQQRALRRHDLMHVKLLVGYCKRRGNLVVSRQTSQWTAREQVELVMSEVMGDLRSVGVDCAALVEVDGPLPTSDVELVYDCLYDVALAGFTYPDLVLMLHVGPGDDEGLEWVAPRRQPRPARMLRIVAETGDGPTTEDVANLRGRLGRHQPQPRLDVTDSGIVLTARLEGGDVS